MFVLYDKNYRKCQRYLPNPFINMITIKLTNEKSHFIKNKLTSQVETHEKNLSGYYDNYHNLR